MDDARHRLTPDAPASRHAASYGYPHRATSHQLAASLTAFWGASLADYTRAAGGW